MQNLLSKVTVLACLFSTPLYAENQYFGAHWIGETMRTSMDEMAATKLQATYFDAAATYMDALDVKQLKLSPKQLRSQLDTAYKDEKYSLSVRQELVDAYQQVDMVTNYLNSNGMSDIESEVMDFCIAENVNAAKWPGIDQIVSKYNAKISVTNIPMSLIYYATSGVCVSPDSWSPKLAQGASKSDFESLPSHIIAYSDSVGNSGGELVYIFENSYIATNGEQPSESYEAFTFFQTSGDDTPDEGIFRRQRDGKDDYGNISSLVANVVCKQCNTANEKFQVETRYQDQNQIVVASSAVESGGKLIPGAVSEESTKAEYMVHAVIENSSVSAVFIDRFNFTNSLIDGRYVNVSSSGGQLTTNNLKAVNLVGEFGLGLKFNDSVNALVAVISNSTYTINKSSGENVIPTTSVTSEDIGILNAIDNISAENIPYTISSIDYSIWNDIK